MNRDRNLVWGLGLLFAVMMSVPFLVPHCGAFALFGIVPLLCMERIGSMSGVKKMWLWHYGAFVLWNAFTTFWVCNATVGGGLFAIFANAFQMSVIFELFRFSKRRFKGALPYLFLALAWIAWERFYFSAQISWPWLVLGNAFAGTVSLAQWYEFTGSLGGSLWIWACNLGLFGIMCCLSDGSWFRFNWKAKTAALMGWICVLFVPMAVSAVIYTQYEERNEGKVNIALAQPNFDPYQKFQSLTQIQQDSTLLSMVSGVRNALIIAPETFTSGMRLDRMDFNSTWRSLGYLVAARPDISVLYGASTYEIKNWKMSPCSREMNDGAWLESHNSGIIMNPAVSDSTLSIDTQIYHKSKLVVGVEMTPFPKFFTKIDDLLGGVMGRCTGQDEVSLLNYSAPGREEVPIGCAICYESVYGEHCTEYVKKGAKMLSVITNDAWWGNTPGYKQHLRYSSLRAIETRRDIARCANTGISAFINQRGDILSQTKWWERTVLEGNVRLNSEETVFVRHGDVVGKLCTFLFLLLFFSLVARSFIK